MRLRLYQKNSKSAVTLGLVTRHSIAKVSKATVTRDF
jgi:hypothetical protein